MPANCEGSRRVTASKLTRPRVGGSVKIMIVGCSPYSRNREEIAAAVVAVVVVAVVVTVAVVTVIVGVAVVAVVGVPVVAVSVVAVGAGPSRVAADRVA